MLALETKKETKKERKKSPKTTNCQDLNCGEDSESEQSTRYLWAARSRGARFTSVTLQREEQVFETKFQIEPLYLRVYNLCVICPLLISQGWSYLFIKQTLSEFVSLNQTSVDPFQRQL